MHLPSKPILDRSLYDGRLRPPGFYRTLGFRSGLEVHQQLLTRRKLYCRCPAGRYSTHHDAVIVRHMRPTLSELGEYDGAALMEFKTRKEVVYLLDSGSVCTYEMDDTPPFELNAEALEIATRIALILNCQIVGEIHVSRKQYLDGSIPTGFQRTAIVGVEGTVAWEDRQIGIAYLSVEEDACREVEDRGHRIIFRTDRLSMPLIEVVTKPELRDPLEVAAVGRRIGDCLRSTGQVRRGIGSVRQDVNVSVEGGSRVEIKGVARIPYFPRLTHNEALRQAGLLRLRDWLVRRRVTPENVFGGSEDVTDLVAATTCPGLRAALTAGHRIRAVVLRGFQAPLHEPIQPCIPFAQEFSGRVRVIACLDQPSNLFVRGAPLGFGLHRHHRACEGSMEPATLRPQSGAPGLSAAHWGPGPVSHDPERGPTVSEWAVISAAVGARPVDGVLMVFGPERDVRTAEQEIVTRAREALAGVPNETRMPFPSGTTDFERILPGADRMYPDTDLPPIELTDEIVARAAASLPELPWLRADRYRDLGLSATAAAQMSVSPFAALFERALEETGLAPSEAYRLFGPETRWGIRRGLPLRELPAEVWLSFARSWSRREIQREAIPEALDRLAWAWRDQGHRSDAGSQVDPAAAADQIVETVLRKLGVSRPPAVQRWMEEAVRAAAHDAPEFVRSVRGQDPGERSRKAARALTGRLRRRFGGLLPGRELRALAEEAVAHLAGRAGQARSGPIEGAGAETRAGRGGGAGPRAIATKTSEGRGTAKAPKSGGGSTAQSRKEGAR